MDKDKIIQVMMLAISDVHSGNIEESRQIAKLALKALCKELPQAPYQIKEGGGIIQFTADGLYQQLKQWGEDD